MRLKTLSDDFINKLAGFAAGALPPPDFENLLKLFASEITKHYFTRSAESNLLRIISGMFDKFFFLSECLRYPQYVNILVSIASNSNYLSDILVINPEFFYLVTDSSVLNRKLDKKNFTEEVEERISRYTSLDAKTHALNSLKRREILRIGMKDICGISGTLTENKAEVAELTSELSILATTLTGKLFKSCYEFILNKYKIKKVSQSYCIISLGKLGGGELNYSSDIDIIIFYDTDTRIGSRYYSEILAETIQLFLEKCSSSEAGNLYRIDLRLRPDGKSSAVCRNIREYLDYYESRGSDWERQMLIKAAYLAGNKNLYNQFIDYLEPFIYPASIFTSPIEQMKKLKKISEDEVRGVNNIKLISGGIRDIEFIVQGLQLLNGGRIKSLRNGNTLKAISLLEESKLLSVEEARILRSAYILYRKIEHYLQLMNNKQTHIIPQSGELAEKLCFFLGFKKLSDFRNKVEENRKQVRAVYDSILEIREIKKSTAVDLSEIRFRNPQKALNDFQFLKEGRGLTISRKFDKQSVESFGIMETGLIKYLQKSVNPDLTLSNFVRVIRYAEFPSIWYHEFTDEKFFTAFLRLCEFSQKSIELFAEDKELREAFLSRQIFRKFNAEELINIKIKKILFLLSSQSALSLITAAEVSRLLSLTVREKIKLAADEFTGNRKWKNDFLIAVLGSTGTGNMSFASDVDLIFAARNIRIHKKLVHTFQDLLKKLRDDLHPLPVDCRLRPEGDSSQLVWDINGYKKYFLNRARIWELQSFLKVKFICGNKRLFNSLIISYLKRIKNLSAEDVLKGMDEIRTKALSAFPPEVQLLDLKKNAGGLNDIEYVAHYFVLTNPVLVNKYICLSAPEILNELSAQKKEWEFLKSLADNYIFLKEIEMFNQVTFNSRSSKISEETERLNKLAGQLKFKDGLELKQKIRSVLKENRDAYMTLINRGSKDSFRETVSIY